MRGVDQYGGDEVLLWVGRVLEGDAFLVDVDVVGDGGLCLLWEKLVSSGGDISSSVFISEVNRLLLLLLIVNSGIIVVIVCFHLRISKKKDIVCY